MLNDIKKILEVNKKEIIEILKEVENEDVAIEEYKLSISALENNKYNSKQVNKIVSFLPMNLPLYSLIAYVIIPRVCGERSVYRPSTLTQKQSKKIHDLLNLSE